MSLPRLRPRFELRLDLAPSEVMERLQELVLGEDTRCEGMIAPVQGHIDMRVPTRDQHLWSPTMSIQVEARADGGSLLRCLVGPNPGIWTAVAFSYLGLGCGLLFLLTLTGVQLGLGHDAWAMPVAATFALLLLTVWVFSLQGRRLAAPQAADLRNLLEQSLGLPAADAPAVGVDPYRP